MFRRRTTRWHGAAVLTLPSRTFFPTPFSGFTVPDAKAVNPLDKLRPPAPPCASDARPFGSLNRSLRPVNYTNMNAARQAPTSLTSPWTSTPAPTTTAAAHESSATTAHSEPPRLDLSKLMKRHRPSEPRGTETSVAPVTDSTAASTTVMTGAAPASLSSSASVTSSAVGTDESTHTVAGSTFFSSLAPHSVVGRDTVARAQSIIAERERALREEAASQELKRKADDTTHRASRSSQQTADASFRPLDASTPSSSSSTSASAVHQQVYREHCTVGWSPEDFFRVVADVNQYSVFLPWCNDSVVHMTRRVRVPPPPQQLAANQESLKRLIGEDGLIEAIQMTATLNVGFSFFNEQYTSLVTLVPGSHITAALYEGDEESAFQSSVGTEVAGSRKTMTRTGNNSSGGGGVGFVSSFFRRAARSANEVAKKSILRNLRCDWEFAPMAARPNEVEVVFSVSFEFKNPMHSRFIMTNVVSLMTHSFENRCEQLYGPPSALRQRLPILNEI